MFSKVFCTAVLAVVSYVAVPTLNILQLKSERASTSEGRRSNMQRLVSMQAANELQPVAADIATSLLDLFASSSRTSVRTEVMPSPVLASIDNPFPEPFAEQYSLADVMNKLDQVSDTQQSQAKVITNLETAQSILTDLVADLDSKGKKPMTYGGVLTSLSQVKSAVLAEDAAAAKLKSDGVCDCNCDCTALIARIEELETAVAVLSRIPSVRSSGGGGSTGSVTSNVYYPNSTTTYSTTGGGSTGSVQANPYVQSVMAMPAVSDDARVRIVEPRRVTRADVRTETTPTYADEYGAPTSGQCVQNEDGTYTCPQATGYSTQTTATPRKGLLGFGLLGRRGK